MRRLIPLILLLAALALPVAAQAAPAAPQAQPAAEKPPDGDSYFQQILPKLRAAQTPAERFEICKDFVTQFPEHKYSVYLLDGAREACGEMKKLPEFLSLVEGVLAAAKSPDVQRGVKSVLVQAYADLGQTDKVKALAGEVLGSPDANAGNYQTLIPVLAKAGLWAEVLAAAAKGEPLTSPESVQKDAPNRQFTPADLKRRSDSRKSFLLTYRGWAKANTGDAVGALADFQAADPLITRNFVGTSYDPLDLYWGKALLMAGRFDDAISRLARPALFGGDPEYKTVLKEAYLKKGEAEAGFDAWLEGLRPTYARAMADFTLPDYAGQEFRFASTQGKVVLLSFWFPT
jgi:tetratricopeptide (TPR) repeat protein